MTSALLARLRALDVDKLGLSEYMRGKLRSLLPAGEYYLSIYEQGLRRLLEQVDRPAEELTLVDYGGGHGLLSLLAREMGIGHVLYVDTNAEAAECYRALGGDGEVVVGDSADLRRYCEERHLVPDMLFGADVIEHVYCIDDMVADVLALNGRMPMLFTTASTPWNRRVVKRLRKVMVEDEREFCAQRRTFLAQHRPDLSAERIDYWAAHTRGLCYDDCLRAVESESPNLLRDPYNTCDPATGSWTERILPMQDYRQLLSPYGYGLQVELGWYNPANRGLKGLVQRHYNRQLLRGHRRSVAPFLFLYMSPEK